MDNARQLTLGLLVAVSLTACDNNTLTVQLLSRVNSATTISEPSIAPGNRDKFQTQVQPAKKLAKSAFQTIEWTDLMPKEDLDALLNPPAYLSEIEDGSFEDQINNQIQSSIPAASNDRYQQALVSTRVVPEMDGKPIRIPGFIVPLEFDDNQTITQFFLVPFFGACIHVPPPPPNQIIFVNYPDGLKLDALYNPFWISGIVKTASIENQMATAAYSLKMQYFEEYTE